MNLKNYISIDFSTSGAGSAKSADNAAKNTKKEDVKNDSIFNQNVEKTNAKDSNVENDNEIMTGYAKYLDDMQDGKIDKVHTIKFMDDIQKILKDGKTVEELEGTEFLNNMKEIVDNDYLSLYELYKDMQDGQIDEKNLRRLGGLI